MIEAVERPDVVVVGAGPAGLGAAIALKRLGVGTVIMLDRETQAGGTPRHCGHPPFGMRELRRVLTGPRYARHLTQRAERVGVDIRSQHTVVALRKGGDLTVASPEGLVPFKPRRVILATGARETSRAARHIGGDRPSGVLNTGALQAMVYLKGLVPFRRPVIVGTELVSFSALLTCRHAGITPVAMIESRPRIVARHPSQLLPRLLGVPLHLARRVVAIHGEQRVSAIETVDANDRHSTIPCDGVLLTGEFVPEATLVRDSALSFDVHSGGPQIDQYGRCSDAAYFAAGNLLRPVETAGWSFREGVQVAKSIAADLSGRLWGQAADSAIVDCQWPFRFVVPQRIRPSAAGDKIMLQLRVETAMKGELRVLAGERCIHRKRIATRPERRVLVALDGATIAGARRLTVTAHMPSS